jgi:flagellar biosynthesis/type III secretory pathway chaperone
VLKLAAQARNENETNGRLINLLLKQNREALSLLLSGGADSIYGTDGQHRSLADGKRSFGKV